MPADPAEAPSNPLKRRRISEDLRPWDDDADNVSAEQRFRTFARIDWPYARKTRLILAIMGFFRLSDGVVCSGCFRLLGKSQISEIMCLPSWSPQYFHQSGCRFAKSLDECAACGVSFKTWRDWKCHMDYAHIEPHLVELKDRTDIQGLFSVVPVTAELPEPTSASPTTSDTALALAGTANQGPASTPTNGSNPEAMVIDIPSPNRQISLSFSSIMAVASIEPSDHVFVVASYDSPSRTFTITADGEVDGMQRSINELTALQILKRITPPKDTLCNQEGETSADESRRPTVHNSVVTFMTRAEYENLRQHVQVVRRFLG